MSSAPFESQIEYGRQPAPRRTARWLTFIPMIAAVALVTALLAIAMFGLFASGWYFFFIVPMLAGLLLSGVVILAIRVGQCRSRVLGLILGVAAGAAMYVGQFEAGFVYILGPRAIAEQQLFPSYVAFRARTDVHLESSRSSRVSKDGTPRPPDPVFNYLTWGFECAICAFLVGTAGWSAGSRTFCEHCIAWRKRGLVFYESGSAESLATLIRENRLPELMRLPSISIGRSKKYTAVAVEYCPPPTGATHTRCSIDLSVKEVSFGGGLGALNQWDAAWGKKTLDHHAISRTDAWRLRDVFPQLARLGPADDDDALAAIPTTDATVYATDDATSGAEQPITVARPAAMATVTPIITRDGERLLSARNVTIGNMIGLLCIAAFFVGGFMIYRGTKIAKPLDYTPTSAVALFVLGGVMILAAALSMVPNPSFLPNRWFVRKTRAMLEARADRVVDPNDPDAIFMEIVPRGNWGRVMMDTAEDVGFAQAHRERRALLFEGDKERYVIPVDAIVDLSLASFGATSGGPGDTIYRAVIVRALTSDGVREFPLVPRMYRWRVSNRIRAAVAESFADAINAIRQPPR